MAAAYWRRLSKQFGTAGWVLSAWGAFYPRPYLLVVSLLAFTPVVGIVVAHLARGSVNPFDDERNEGLATFVIIPPLILSLRAILDFPLIDGWRLSVYGAAFGVAWGLLYLWTRPNYAVTKRKRWWDVAAGWVGAMWYGGTIVAMLNGILPQGAPQLFVEPVLDRHISGGKHPSYYLTLPPFGPVNEQDDWDVGRTVYQEVHIGDRVCGYIYPGALREPWYDIEPCEHGQTVKEGPPGGERDRRAQVKSIEAG